MKRTSERSSVLAPKKTYSKPVLVEYGDLSRITQAIGATGKNDTAHGNTKTGL